MNEMLPSSYACPTSIFSSTELSTGEPVYSTLYVPVFGSETDLGPSYEDFEYIDSAAPGEVKGWTYYPLFSQTDSAESHAMVSSHFQHITIVYFFVFILEAFVKMKLLVKYFIEVEIYINAYMLYSA